MLLLEAGANLGILKRGSRWYHVKK